MLQQKDIANLNKDCFCEAIAHFDHNRPCLRHALLKLREALIHQPRIHNMPNPHDVTSTLYHGHTNTFSTINHPPINNIGLTSYVICLIPTQKRHQPRHILRYARPPQRHHPVANLLQHLPLRPPRPLR